jgi:hypothetical protein
MLAGRRGGPHVRSGQHVHDFSARAASVALAARGQRAAGDLTSAAAAAAVARGGVRLAAGNGRRAALGPRLA